MNILEALEVALPDLPSRPQQAPLCPGLNIPRYPQGTHRARRAHRSRENAWDRIFLRFSPEQWQLLELFDGERSYQQISDLIIRQTNVAYTEEDVKQFASYLEQDGDLFYKTPLEKNITLRQKLSNERQKRSRFQIADVTNITLHTWPRADEYLSASSPTSNSFTKPGSSF